MAEKYHRVPTLYLSPVSDREKSFLTSTPLVKVTAKTSVTVKKTATETITETKTVTTKVETFNKAKKGKLKFKLATASDGMSGVPVREALERLNFKYGYQGELVFVSNSDLVIAG